jgi:hypothetical protein
MSKNYDKELEFLEDEFLKCNLEDIPLPIDKIEEDLEEEIGEVMKSGCNRQIAEYVILKYQELKNDEDGKPKLIDFKNNYVKSRDEYFNEIKKNIKTKKNEFEIIKAYISQKDNRENINDKYIDQLVDDKLRDYMEEIKKVTENYKNNDKDNEINSDEYRETIKYILFKNLFIEAQRDNDEKLNKFFEERKKYIQKRDAVVEACLRKVKKIVNDDDEYNKFNKEYKEIMKNNKGGH